MKVAVITLGCPKNLVESERIIGQMTGQVELTGPEEADVLILKTCGFIDPAIRESEDWIEKLARLKDGGEKRLIVAGCLVNRFGAGLQEKYPPVDDFIRLNEEKTINQILGLPIGPEDKRFVTTFPYAYLMIADGCDNRCRFCTIPQIRGRYRSFSPDRLVAESEVLAELGIKELILVAQDTGYYGYDIAKRSLLPGLLDRLSRIDGIEWIRIMYLNPGHISDELIERISNSRKVCRYLDVPIQHISDKILKLMGRKAKKPDLVKLLSKLRKIDGLALRTTLMIGFPGEKDEHFEELLSFVKDVGFEHFGVFAFSPEPGTRAYDLPDRVEAGVVANRVQVIEELRDSLTNRFNRSFIGKRVRVLIDGPGQGRREFDAPEIDSVVQIKDKIKVGEFVDVKIESADIWQIKGRVCQ